MSKPVKYLTLDTETATLPFTATMNLTAEQKKNVAIARPLVYDIGWTIATRSNGIIEERNFLVAEVFSVPSIFNTAYYKEKRPKYIEMLKTGDITVQPWDTIMDILLNDLASCDFCTAYNAMFDFKKAIPFTECYIRHLYGDDYAEWEQIQYSFCKKLANGYKSKSQDEFDRMNFNFRGYSFPIVDVWGQACSTYINTDKYRKECLKRSYITNSGTYFKTSAEVVKRYLEQEYDFIEAHTALDDARIETEILFHCLRRSKRINGIIDFPFRELGETVEFCANGRNITEEMFANTFNALRNYLETAPDVYPSGKANGYKTSIQNELDKLLDAYELRFGDNRKGLEW